MPFRARGATHDIPYLDIRLDDDVLIFRGSQSDGVGALLKGHVALCIRENTQIRSITLILQGIKRLQSLKHEEIFYEKRWKFLEGGGSRGFTLAPNNYAYEFSVPLEASLPESVEGLEGTHIIYRLKARVVRGMLAHDVVAKKHMRIVRTLAPGALELSQTMCVQNIWPNKVEYSISIPSKAVVYGTHIPIEITLVPLLKGLKIGKVICHLKETHTFSFKRIAHKKNDTRNILTRTFNEHQQPEELLPASDDEDDSEFGTFRLHERIPLPKSLNVCVQDCDVEEIKVRHKVSFNIQLHNPEDGHISELRASLPVFLFISPSYLMDSSNQIPATADQPDESEDVANAPPRYDQHSLDRLYDALPLREYDTPIHSGANTPRILSRSNSSENLASFHPLSTTSSAGSPTSGSGASSTEHPATANSSSSSLEQPALHLLPDESSGRWRWPTAAGHPPTPRTEEELNTLCKVPSYATAVRSDIRNLPDPVWNGLPEYDEDIARRPSPPRRTMLHRGVLTAGRSW